MANLARIAAYTRISVDIESDSNENTSIENQKSILADFVSAKFPDCEVDFFEDRDRSGYTFEEREAYSRMRPLLLNGYYRILVVKDFSRFSRRNSKGLVELEDLRDAGVRIIAVTDGVDYPTNDEWLTIQFRFLMNEMPVTDTSKKVKSIISNRQKKGEWICNVPYGYYLHPTKKNEICVDEEGAATVKLIFDLYNKGYGYKRMANYLTENHYPTGKMLQKKHLEAKGQDTSHMIINPIWSHVSIAKIIQNDFYIGVLRQNVWQRAGINKKDIRVDKKDHIVFENHHIAIVDKETFEKAQEQLTHRSTHHYKGVRKYNIPYSGYLFCEDCGSPLFSISNPNRPPAYTCGAYHRRGLKGCTAHHIHEKVINDSIKTYIRTVRDNLQEKLLSLNYEKSKQRQLDSKRQIEKLTLDIANLKKELSESKKQRIRQITKDPENEELINESYDAVDREYHEQIKRLETQIAYLTDDAKKKSELKRNIGSILETFDVLLNKEAFTREDIALIVDRITVDQDKVVTIFLKSRIEELFETVNSFEDQMLQSG